MVGVIDERVEHLLQKTTERKNAKREGKNRVDAGTRAEIRQELTCNCVSLAWKMPLDASKFAANFAGIGSPVL